MKKITFGLGVLGLMAVIASCQSSGTGESTTDDSTQPSIALTAVTGSPTFPDATLKIDKITSEKTGDSAKIDFAFAVSNYELTQQTPDATNKECSNSAKGQHIHFILDDKPYAALYKPEHSVTLPVNTEHYLLCFLSRSYHESLKNPSASVLVHFKVDENGKIQKLDVPATPMIFYSRPKGSYLGDDAKNVMLDFYVYGGTLGDSLQVKATIDDTTINISQWQPYFIQNAPMGTLNVKLQLTDGGGQPIQGVNTEADRSATLAQSEPIAP